MRAVEGADALFVVIEWKVYRSPNWVTLKAAIRTPGIFNGRNLYHPKAIQQTGVNYIVFGRGRLH